MGIRKGFNDYRIVGDVAYVALTNRKNEVIAETMLDVADLAALQAGVRRLSIRHRTKHKSSGPYAWIRFKGGQELHLLHRVLMNPPAGMVVDHINGNGLDNRRSNLRICTQTENSRNCRKRTESASAYKGVHPSGRTKNPWRASIRHHGTRKHLGHFETEVEAARAYDEAAVKMFGEFASLNFPKGGN